MVHFTVDGTCQVITLTEPAQLTATISADGSTTVCAGQPTTLSVAITGGTPPYTINGNATSGSSPFIFTVIPSTFPITTYNNTNITVSDAGSCGSSTTGSVAISSKSKRSYNLCNRRQQPALY